MMPLPEKVKYHLEPLPSSLTPLQRMEKGTLSFPILHICSPPVPFCKILGSLDMSLQSCALQCPLLGNSARITVEVLWLMTDVPDLCAGIAAFFGIETEIASEPELAGLTVQDVPVPRAQGEQGEAAQEHTGNSQVSAFLSGSISVAHTAADQDSTNPTPSSVCEQHLLSESSQQFACEAHTAFKGMSSPNSTVVGCSGQGHAMDSVRCRHPERDAR